MKHSFYLCFKKKQRGRSLLGVRVTERQPQLDSGEVAIHMNVDLPDALFVRPMLQATITIPANKITPTTIDATVANNIADVVHKNLGLDMRIEVVDSHCDVDMEHG